MQILITTMFKFFVFSFSMVIFVTAVFLKQIYNASEWL